MKQERYKEALAWLERSENAIKMFVMANARRTGVIYTAEKGVFRQYAAAKKALKKAISKPVRMDGSRAHCPDCGAGVRKSDNYCFRCGQRLEQREQKKKQPFYGRYIKA